MNVLVLGNGFDIYHKLPTRYTDFLFLVEHWNDFYSKYLGKIKKGKCITLQEMNIRVGEKGEMTVESLKDYISCAVCLNPQSLQLLDKYIDSNFWLGYFESTNYKKENWIDFENEVEKVLSSIEHYFSIELTAMCNDQYSGVLDPNYTRIIKYVFENTELLREIPPFEMTRTNYVKLAYSDQKKALLKKLKLDLDELIDSIRIYFEEFVEKMKVEFLSQQLQVLNVNRIINFNYTDTYERRYGWNAERGIHAIHGSLSKKDLVLGISDTSFDELDYIYFQKYFQRIQKKTGSMYLEWLRQRNAVFSEPVNVIIFGHSLGRTDKSILDDIFLNEKYVMYITIFYHCQEAYEKLVIALVDLYGKEYVIEQTGRDRIVFELLDEPLHTTSDTAVLYGYGSAGVD